MSLGRDKTGNVARRYFELALKQFEMAFELDPGFIDARNEYAYAFWQWLLSYRAGKADSAPTPDIAKVAEEQAREAVRLSFARRDLAQESMTLDTLGEVLIGEGRLSEAVEVIRRAQDPEQAEVANKGAAPGQATSQSIPTDNSETAPFAWPLDHEIYWDLAAAELCMADNADKTRKNALYTTAYRTLADLRHEELTDQRQMQEWAPFYTNKYASPAGIRQFACPNEPVAEKAMFEAEVKYSKGQACAMTAVRFDSKLLKLEAERLGLGLEQLRLHVWGHDTDDLLSVNDADWGRSIQVDAADQDVIQGIYYAELEGKDGKALSAPKSFDVYPDARDCKKNQIELRFRANKLDDRATRLANLQP